MGEYAAVGYHPYRGPMRLLLPRWVTGERAGRWVSLTRFLVDGAPYGGLVGSLDDAARFLRMHLRGGELDGVRVIDADSAARMRKITIEGEGSTSGSAGSGRGPTPRRSTVRRASRRRCGILQSDPHLSFARGGGRHDGERDEVRHRCRGTYGDRHRAPFEPVTLRKALEGGQATRHLRTRSLRTEHLLIAADPCIALARNGGGRCAR